MGDQLDKAEFVDGQPRERRVAVAELDLSAERIARELGYADGRWPDQVARVVEPNLARAAEMIEPRMLWLPAPCTVDRKADTLTVGDTTFEIGQMMRAHVQRASAVALFVVTVGPQLETAARAQLRDGQMLEGYTLDAIGSSAAEAVADVAEADIRQAAEAVGWKITNRLSPGYCQWATHEQSKLFALLPDRPCGIRLTDSALMVPIKSVSGIVGLGPTVKHLDYMCSICNMTTCHKRREGPGET